MHCTGILKPDRPRLRCCMFVLAALAFGPPAGAQIPSLEVQLDLQRLRTEALVSTDRGSLVSRYSFLERAATNEETPPEFSISVSASALYNSNAESAATQGTSTFEGNPEMRLAWSKQMSAWALSALVDANSVRYVRSQGADGDTSFAQLQVQHIDPDDDTAFAPFVSYSPSLAFAPTFSKRTATTHDLSIGFDKMFNFDEDREHLHAPDTVDSAVWSIGLTGTAARSFADSSPSSGASPSSYNLSVAPSLTYNSRDPNALQPDAQWSTSFEVAVTRLFYDRDNGFERHDWLWSPILTTKYVPPLRWFKRANENDVQANDRRTRLGQPTLLLQLAFSQLSSNLAGAQFHQWTLGPTLNVAWSF
jgi:hypothetical protein